MDVQPSSAVRLAKRKSDGLDVVVKRREKSIWQSKKQEEQEWRRSADMLLNLPKSDNIAQLYDVLEDEEAYYVVMEKVQGEDLFEMLHSDVRVTADDTNAILYRLLEAVKELHAKGCIHKDLKLENVMLDSPSIRNRNPWSRADLEDDVMMDMVVKIIDFDTVEAFSPKTISKHVVGTDQYIAHEAYDGRYSPASDIFSIGVIAYKLISGRFPFQGVLGDEDLDGLRIGSPKLKEIQDRLKTFSVNFDSHPWTTLPKAKDLVSWMLQCNEIDRPTAEQALEHPFFAHRTPPPTPTGER